MKKLVVTLSLLLVALSAFSITLGIYVDNFKGQIQGYKETGIYVNKVEPNYPASGNIMIGDIISEAVLIGQGKVWWQSCAPTTGDTLYFNPLYTLHDQLFVIKNTHAVYRYEDIGRWQDMSSLLNRAKPGDTVLLRIYRTQWEDWIFVAVSLGASGQYTFVSMPEPQPYVAPQPVLEPIAVTGYTIPVYTTYIVGPNLTWVPFTPIVTQSVVVQPSLPTYVIVIWLP